MPGYNYVNPYTPETPIGAGLQNIAMALFAGKQNQGKQAIDDSHMAYYDAMARKAAAEAENERRRGAFLTPESIDESVAASFALPRSRVSELRNLPAPGTTLMPPSSPYSPMARQIGERLLAVRLGLADKTVNPEGVAKADQAFAGGRAREGVMSGDLDPRSVAQAFFATSGKAPYSGGETGSTDLTTGAQQLNPIGEQRAERERQQGRNYGAQAAGREEENRSGVKMGAPVLVAGEDGQPPVYTAPRAALGRNPGLNPNSAAARPASGGAGDTTTETDIKPIKPSKNDMDLLLGGIDRATGGQLADKALTGAILQRAASYFGTPGSQHYGNQEAAARAAVRDILPDGAEMSGVIGFRQLGPKGQPHLDLGPIALTGPTKVGKKVTRGPTKPAAAPASPAAAAPAPSPNVPPRPAGKSDEQLIAEANAAIKAGRDRNLVMQRLQAWGVQVQ